MFDDPNLIAHAGLVPVLRLAERCGLSRLVAQKVKLTGAKNGAGAAADAKVTSVVLRLHDHMIIRGWCVDHLRVPRVLEVWQLSEPIIGCLLAMVVDAMSGMVTWVLPSR
ncbi:hypothetical protein [Streptomyces sp. NPDC051286]|uniref:hypothetical protein n=1 Tax=Streptomyces sp. NPDC051286 TaxID=3365647 RepID=UPI0037984A06